MNGFAQLRKVADQKPRLKSRLIATMLATTVALSSLPGQVGAQSYSFSNVSVEGNQRVDPRTILGHARIGRGAPMSAAALNDAYQRLVNSGLFETVELLPRGNTLVIAVKEFPTLNVVHFEGNKRLKTDILQKLVQSQAHRIYSPATAEADAAAISEAYNVQGRLSARVEPRIIRRDGNRVDLVFEIAEGKLSEVEQLSFVGNRNFSDRRLRQVLSTKQAGLLRQFISRDTYVAERIDVDKQLLRDFYLSRGYIDFQVVDASSELARGQDGFFVTFTVREGQQFSFGQTQVVSEIDGIDASAYASLLRLRPGETYSPSQVEAVTARMEAKATRDGVNFLRVEPRIKRNDRERRLDIDFALVRGERIFVERIDIEGNTTTMDQVIRRQFRTVEGDPLNPREVREAAERIRALGYFENANVEASEGSSPESVIVKATVEEKPTGSLSFGASFGKTDGLGASIGLSEANFLGRGQFVAVNLNLGASNATSSFTFSEPSVLGRDLKFTLTGFYTETEANYSTWDTRAMQLRAALEFPISTTTRFEPRYTIGRSKMFNVEKSGAPANEIPSPILVNEANLGSLTGSALGYQLSYDSRREGLTEPTAYVFRLNQDAYGIGGDLKFLKTEVFAGMERQFLNGDLRVRAEFEAGAITGTGDKGTRVMERYFLDGKLRGFEPFGIGPRDNITGGAGSRQDPLGGKMFAVARVEADFPVGLPEEYGIRGGVFLDAGSVWGLDKKLGHEVVDDSAKLRAAAGVSLLWDTPMGPLRFNFSKALRKEDYDKEQTFDLTISTKF